MNLPKLALLGEGLMLMAALALVVFSAVNGNLPILILWSITSVLIGWKFRGDFMRHRNTRK